MGLHVLLSAGQKDTKQPCSILAPFLAVVRKQHLPGRLRPLPAIGADGLGSVFGGDIAGLVFEDLVGDLQLVAPCRLGRFRSQAAPVADGRGDVDLLAVEPLMMLVGQFQVISGNVAVRTVVPTTLNRPSPHSMRYQDIGSPPKTRAKAQNGTPNFSQKQWSFDVRRHHVHVGHQKGRADAVSRVVFQRCTGFGICCLADMRSSFSSYPSAKFTGNSSGV